MRSIIIDSNDIINKNLHFLETYFISHNHEAIVKVPKKSIRTLFYNKKPNNRNNLKQLTFFPLNKQIPLMTSSIKNQTKIKGASFYDLFFDKNQSTPFYQTENNNYHLNSTTFSSKQNSSISKTKTQSIYGIEKTREQKNIGNFSLYKSNVNNRNKFGNFSKNMNNGLSTDYHNLAISKLYKSQKQFNFKEPLTNNIYKNLNTLYQEFITNVIYIIFKIIINIFIGHNSKIFIN